MPVGQQDRGGVTVALAVLPGGLRQPLDFGLFEVFARSLCHDCYIYCCWSLEMGMLIFHRFRPFWQ
jgi:hypothetical protein